MMKRVFFYSCAMLIFPLFLGAEVFALSLDEAKQQGLVGEKPNGYLGVVQAKPSAEVKQLMDGINAKRKLRYQKIAKGNGTELSVVEQIGGKKAIEKTAPGNFVLLPSGEWKKK